jgi:hypothetical protein
MTAPKTQSDKDVRSFHVAGNEHSFHLDGKKGETDAQTSSFKKLSNDKSFKKVG